MRPGPLLALVALLLCGPFRTADAEPDGTLRIGVESGLATLDPHAAAGPMELHVAEACFEGLVIIDPETLQPAPGLASSWEASEDRRTWTFRLREDARWSDGTPITARDVAAGIRRALAPTTQAPFAFALRPLRGARAWHDFGGALLQLAGGRGLVAALEARAARAPEGLDAAAWARWIGRDALPEVLDEAPEPLLREAVRGTRAHWSPADLARLVASLRAAMERMRAAHDAAAAAFGISEGVVPVDARTVRIELERPHPHLLRTLAMPVAAPVPPAAHEPPKSKAARARGLPATAWWRGAGPVVSGPYRVLRRVRRRGRDDFGVVLARNEAHALAETIRQARIEVVVVDDAKDNLRRFTEGRLDWATSWPRDVTPQLARSPSMRIAESNVVAYYALRLDHPALRDVRVRRALATSIDREALIAAVPGLLARPAPSLVPDAVPAREAPATDLARDVEAARALLREALPDGPEAMPPMALLYNASETNREIATAVAGQWRRQLGIRVRLEPVTWFEFQARRLLGQFAVSRAGWVGDFPGALDFLELFEGDSRQNVSGWRDEAYDALLAEARAAATPEARAALCARAESRLLGAGVPCIPLYWYRQGDLVQKRVRGFRTRAVGSEDGRPGVHNVQGLHPFRGLWIEARPR